MKKWSDSKVLYFSFQLGVFKNQEHINFCFAWIFFYGRTDSHTMTFCVCKSILQKAFFCSSVRKLGN
jgi:hypothetical protein